MKELISFIMVVGLAVQGLAWERSRIPSGDPRKNREQTQNQSSIAEEYLCNLAKKLKSRRMTYGIAGGVIGASGVAGGIALLSYKEDVLGINRYFGTLCLVGGGIYLTAATISLASPTKAEREYATVRDIKDPAERERISAAALSGLAKRGRVGRMIRGGLLSAAAVLSAGASGKDSSSDQYLVAFALGGWALYSFLGKSSEEETYLNYLERTRPKTVPDFAFGLAPRGGIWVGFSVDF